MSSVMFRATVALNVVPTGVVVALKLKDVGSTHMASALWGKEMGANTMPPNQLTIVCMRINESKNTAKPLDLVPTPLHPKKPISVKPIKSFKKLCSITNPPARAFGTAGNPAKSVYVTNLIPNVEVSPFEISWTNYTAIGAPWFGLCGGYSRLFLHLRVDDLRLRCSIFGRLPAFLFVQLELFSTSVICSK